MDLFYSAAFQIQATRYAKAAGFTILLYDSCLNLADEVQYIWTWQWGWPKVLLFLNRFTSFLCLVLNLSLDGRSRPPNDHNCHPWGVAFTAFLGVVAVASSNWLLLARVLALYEQKRTIVYTLVTLYVLTLAANVILVTFAVRVVSEKWVYIPIAHICGVMNRLPLFSFAWLSPVILEILNFTMAASKLLPQARLMPVGEKRGIWHILLRDGLLYFLVTAIAGTVNMLAWSLFPPSLIFIAFFLPMPIVSSMLTRMSINLRKAGVRDNSSVLTTTHSHS